MHTLTIQTDDTFYDLLEDLEKKQGKRKDQLIVEAVMKYDQHLQQKLLQDQIKKASIAVRQSSKRSNEEFEKTLQDGLNDV